MTGRVLAVVSITLALVGAAGPAAAQPTPAPQPTFRWDDHPSIRFGRGTHIDFAHASRCDARRSDAPLTDEDRGIRHRAAPRRRRGRDQEPLRFPGRARAGQRRDAGATSSLNYKQFDDACRCSVGKFKLPFSLDENTSATNLDFVYRSLAATFLAPGPRHAAHGARAGREANSCATSSASSSTTAATPARGDSTRVIGGQTIAGRRPRRAVPRLEVGGRELEPASRSPAATSRKAFPALRGRTVLDAAFFRPDYLVGGRRERRGLEAQWRPGPFSVKSEWIRVSDERLRAERRGHRPVAAARPPAGM